MGDSCLRHGAVPSDTTAGCGVGPLHPIPEIEYCKGSFHWMSGVATGQVTVLQAAVRQSLEKRVRQPVLVPPTYYTIKSPKVAHPICGIRELHYTIHWAHRHSCMRCCLRRSSCNAQCVPSTL